MKRWMLGVLLAAACCSGENEWQARPQTNALMMRHYWLQQVAEATDRADAARAALATKEQAEAYQRRIRERFVGALGGFPARTPLNARTVGVIARDGYRVEKVLFESQPNHHVTALLYLPGNGDAQAPGVLVPCGHSAGGKDCDAYQWVCANLARNGMAALLYDPLDQGERAQLLDAAGKPRVSGTAAHSRLGVGSILLGRSTATFRIWDGMRALDYLASRPEVDPGRLGCTGNSGGGTLTSYLMALDPRIRAAAPSCYITDLRHVAEKIGPQDAEQNIFGQLAFGMDHAEYVALRAPNPTLVCSATKDFFDIDGARASVGKARHVYELFGAGDRLAQCVADEKHGFTAPLRAGAVGWMKRWLLDSADVLPERPDEPLIRGAEAWCTPGGQVMLLPGERSAHDINRMRNAELARARAALWQDPAAALEQVRQVTGIRRLSELPPGVTDQEEAYRSLKSLGKHPVTFCLRPEPGIELAALLYGSEVPLATTVTLLVCGAGAWAADAEEIAACVKRGETVVVAELRGLGLTQGGVIGDRDDKLGLEWKDAFAAYLLGTSYLAKRAEDVLQWGRFARGLPREEVKVKVRLAATGVAVPAALHAAALEPGLFEHVTLIGGLASWSELLEHPLATNQLINAVHGALRVYDLPELVKSLPACDASQPLPLE